MGIKASVLTILAALTVVSAVVSESEARPKFEGPKPSARPEADGPEVPFPLDATIPFPWNKIEGVWQASTPQGKLYFSFDVETDYNGRQLLHVTQLQGETSFVVSEGVGVSVPNDNLVRAAMAGHLVGNYMLYIGAYKNPKPALGMPKVVTVLTLRPFGAADAQNDIHYVVTKVSSHPIVSAETVCR